MTDLELAVAAFVKMYRGEPLSINDAQRVFSVFIEKPPQVDSQNQAQLQQLFTQAREGIQRTYFQQK